MSGFGRRNPGRMTLASLRPGGVRETWTWPIPPVPRHVQPVLAGRGRLGKGFSRCQPLLRGDRGDCWVAADISGGNGLRAAYHRRDPGQDRRVLRPCYLIVVWKPPPDKGFRWNRPYAAAPPTAYKHVSQNPRHGRVELRAMPRTLYLVLSGAPCWREWSNSSKPSRAMTGG